MIVANYMTSHPHFLSPEHSLAAAHRLMRRHKIRHLPIIEDGKLMGLVSQRDLFFVEALCALEQEEVCVSEAMRKDVLTISPSTPVSEVARTMLTSRSGSMVVLDEGAVVGIFTTIDALRALLELTELSDQILKSAD